MHYIKFIIMYILFTSSVYATKFCSCKDQSNDFINGLVATTFLGVTASHVLDTRPYAPPSEVALGTAIGSMFGIFSAYAMYQTCHGIKNTTKINDATKYCTACFWAPADSFRHAMQTLSFIALTALGWSLSNDISQKILVVAGSTFTSLFIVSPFLKAINVKGTEPFQ